MDMKQSLSKLSKNIVKGKDIVIRTSENLIDISKLNSLIASKSTSIDELYKKLGQKFYKKAKKSKQVSEEFSKLISLINKEKKELKDLEEKLAHLKNKKYCKYCNSEIPKDCIFCPECGGKQS